MLYHIILKSTNVREMILLSRRLYEIDINELLLVLKFQAALCNHITLPRRPQHNTPKLYLLSSFSTP